ncbi:MAG: GNAT family N-acetyltransferase [Thermoplasmatota archaeon]
MVTLELGSANGIMDLRKEYINGLSQAQELYNEMMLRDATPYMIMVDVNEAGYLFLEGSRLLEFHLRSEHVPDASEIFGTVLRELNVKKAVCQSFDHLFLSQCILHKKRMKVMGYLFREMIAPEEPIEDKGLAFRTAGSEDLGLIEKFRDGIFDDNEVKEIPYWIKKGSIMIFECGGNEFIGYGIFNRTVKEKEWYDVGMYVSPRHRKKGFGAYIVDRMIKHVEGMGGVPNAGCDVNNEASKRTLERAGFISKHLILEFVFPRIPDPV